METVKTFVQTEWSGNSSIVSVLYVKSPGDFSPLIDSFDELLLVVSNDPAKRDYITHYIKDNLRIQERWVSQQDLSVWILSGLNRSIIQWILQGEIFLDRESYLVNLKQELILFPILLREQKLLSEFSYFLKRYLQSKEYLGKGNTLDAYGNILEALIHWARIVIIEEGIHPEVTVWKQVKKINLGVYKLYEELTLSTETLEQRVQLVLLVCEFSVMSKMEQCCAMLMRILKSRETPWSISELTQHPDLKEIHVELALVVNKLAKRSLIKEVFVMNNEEADILEMKYTH